MNVKPHTVSILKKHVGSSVSLVTWEKDGLWLREGKISSVSNDGVRILSKILTEGNLLVPYYNSGKKNLLHVYNKLYIDIMTGKETPSLAQKLNSGDYKVLIDSMKPRLNKIIHIVFRQQKGPGVANGRFADMGLKELMVKPAPFFNSELRLAYNTILHIYGDDDDDLIG